MSRHFRQRARQRLGTQQGDKLIALVGYMLQRGNVPSDGNYSVPGYCAVVVKGGIFTTLLDPEMTVYA